MPVTRDVVARFVAGDTAEQAMASIERLLADGLLASIDYLGEDTTDASRPPRWPTSTCAAERLAARLAAGGRAEVSVKPTAVGLGLAEHGEKTAAENIKADRGGGPQRGHDGDAGHGGPHPHRRHPAPGQRAAGGLPGPGLRDPVLPAAQPGRLPGAGHGGLAGPAVQGRLPGAGRRRAVGPADVDVCYARCLRILMEAGLPDAGHPRPAADRADRDQGGHGRRDNGSFEYQMLYGIRPAEQRRLADAGAQVRVYVPYGEDWYGYLIRRLAERPENLASSRPASRAPRPLTPQARLAVGRRARAAGHFGLWAFRPLPWRSGFTVAPLPGDFVTLPARS